MASDDQGAGDDPSAPFLPCSRLPELWGAGVRVVDIAAILEISHGRVSRLAATMGLPTRGGRSWGEPAVKRMQPPRRRKPVLVVVKADDAAPGPGLDANVLATKGKYAELALVAEKFGLSLREVTLAWHRLR